MCPLRPVSLQRPYPRCRRLSAATTLPGREATSTRRDSCLPATARPRVCLRRRVDHHAGNRDGTAATRGHPFEFCQRLLKVPPRQLHAAVALAQALRSLNQHETALNVIDKALKVRPASRALRCMHAGYLIEVNEKEAATKPNFARYCGWTLTTWQHTDTWRPSTR